MASRKSCQARLQLRWFWSERDHGTIRPFIHGCVWCVWMGGTVAFNIHVKQLFAACAQILLACVAVLALCWNWSEVGEKYCFTMFLGASLCFIMFHLVKKWKKAAWFILEGIRGGPPTSCRSWKWILVTSCVLNGLRGRNEYLFRLKLWGSVVVAEYLPRGWFKQCFQDIIGHESDHGKIIISHDYKSVNNSVLFWRLISERLPPNLSLGLTCRQNVAQRIPDRYTRDSPEYDAWTNPPPSLAEVLWTLANLWKREPKDHLLWSMRFVTCLHIFLQVITSGELYNYKHTQAFIEPPVQNLLALGIVQSTWRVYTLKNLGKQIMKSQPASSQGVVSLSQRWWRNSKTTKITVISWVSGQEKSHAPLSNIAACLCGSANLL